MFWCNKKIVCINHKHSMHSKAECAATQLTSPQLCGCSVTRHQHTIQHPSTSYNMAAKNSGCSKRLRHKRIFSPGRPAARPGYAFACVGQHRADMCIAACYAKHGPCTHLTVCRPGRARASMLTKCRSTHAPSIPVCCRCHA